MKEAVKGIFGCICGALAVIGIFAIIGAANGNRSFIDAFDKQQEQQVDNDITNDETNDDTANEDSTEDQTQEDENQSEEGAEA